MGERSLEATRGSIEALKDNDMEAARKVIALDNEIDRLELIIDQESIRYLSLRAPVASELRLLTVAMKISQDLERVGDEATGIAKRVVRLAALPQRLPLLGIEEMSVLAMGMLRDAMDSLFEENADKALGIAARDKAVDRLNKDNFKQLAAKITENPSTVSVGVELMFISKSIERIGDHACNIGEEVIFLLKGDDIRHSDAARRTT